ncbi:putative Protein kinase [Leptomonas seymouri]|uniref:Protein kinase domain-containing protein n=1 Tax=Leptomonas seymouri TaxID=5684 RepID=A0A0N1ILR5_LEPSE|nr:putative Protein kinase [Leptomonas seymouri]|eukprot:KPI88724.1 putative Protein kinase [Leptomonas seymouri]
MDGVLDVTSPNSGGATPRRIVKSLKQPLACVTQLVPLDGGENYRSTNLLARLPAASIPSEASVSEVRSELCSMAYEEPGDESSSSFFDHRRVRHGGKVNSSMSRSKVSRTGNGSRVRPRRSFRSVSSREVEESFLSYSDEPVFYQCDFEASSGSAVTEVSNYSMSYTAISESVPSCSLTTLADPGRSISGGWAGRFRKSTGNTNSGPSCKTSGSFFGSGGIDPYNGLGPNAHLQQVYGRDSSSSQFVTATRGGATSHRKATTAGMPLSKQYRESLDLLESPIAFENTFSPSGELPVAKNELSDAPSVGDTTALPEAADALHAEDNEGGDAATLTNSSDLRQKVQHVKLLGRVGRGTFGDVYRAEDCDTGNIIAVKEIVVPHDFTKDIEKQLAALESEIRVMRRLHHPHVVTYLGANREGNTLRIFMEFVGGGTVGSTLEREGALPEEKTRNYTAQLLEGLEYLHASHILHRDLKGDNLFLTEQDQLKLGDFGQSKELADTLITQSVQGTPSFMSPEMIACSGYSFEADIWSVGCCVIQMLTGKPPFSNLDNQMAVMFAIISSKIEEQIPQNVSEGAKDFIRMCTKTNIKDRWSATQLRQHPWLLGVAKENTSTLPAKPANAVPHQKGKPKSKEAESPSVSNGKPPRSILLDTTALSKTNTTDEPRKMLSEVVYQHSFNGDTPDNEAGDNASSNLSSTGAENSATQHTIGDRHARPLYPSRVNDNGAHAAGASNTPRMSPAVPPQPSPGGRRPPRLRNGVADCTADGDLTSKENNAARSRVNSSAVVNEANGSNSNFKTSSAHAAAQKPHRPAQAPGESSPRRRPVILSNGAAAGTEVPGSKRRGSNDHNSGSSCSDGNAPRTSNTAVNTREGRGAVSPSHPRNGSRHTGSTTQHVASPGHHTGRATSIADEAKPRAPATSRRGCHLSNGDRKK